MSEGIVEVRDYTIEADWFEAYCRWAQDHAVPWLQAHADVIGFWVHDGAEADVTGSDPKVSPHGQPNVCWALRWPSLEARHQGWAEIGADPAWLEVRSRHPNPDAYLHTNVRYLREVATL